MKLLQHLFSGSLFSRSSSSKTCSLPDKSSPPTPSNSNKTTANDNDTRPAPLLLLESPSSRLLGIGPEDCVVTPASAVLLTTGHWHDSSFLRRRNNTDDNWSFTTADDNRHHEQHYTQINRRDTTSSRLVGRAFETSTPVGDEFSWNSSASSADSTNANDWSPTLSDRSFTCSGSSEEAVRSTRRSAARRPNSIVVRRCNNNNEQDVGQVSSPPRSPSSSTATSPSLPRSRSLIRTNPWLAGQGVPPTSPRTSPRAGRAASPMSVSSGGSSSAAVSPDNDVEEQLTIIRMQPDADADVIEKITDEQVASADDIGYCSVSSLAATNTDDVDNNVDHTSATGSSMAGSRHATMDMSVDSLSSMFHQMTSSQMLASVTSSGICSDNNPGAIGFISGSVATKSLVKDEEIEATQSAAGWEARETRNAVQCEDDIQPHHTDESDVLTGGGLSRHLARVQSVFTCSQEDKTSDELLSVDYEQLSVRHETTEEEDDDDDNKGCATERGVSEIKSSLAASVERLRRDRRAVDEAFRRARSEERQRARELARIRRRVAEARRDVLLNTLRELSRDLSGQCQRLQAAYDALLVARWPDIHQQLPTAAPGSLAAVAGL